MAAWLLCLRQGGNAGQHLFWPRGRVSSPVPQFPHGWSAIPLQERTRPAGLRTCYLPSAGRVKPDGPGRPVPCAHPLRAAKRPCCSVQQTPTHPERPKVDFLKPLLSPPQPPRVTGSPGWSPATLLASCVTLACHSPSLNHSFHICKMEIGILPSPASPELRGWNKTTRQAWHIVGVHETAALS